MKKEQKTWISLAALVFITGMTLLMPLMAKAAVPKTYTNDNIWQSEHDVPVSFTRDAAGNFEGYTATGKRFTQINIENALSIRLQKFSIDQAFFYISDRGVIEANSDIVALSIYLTLG